MKKKILIVGLSLRTGGIERSLINFLEILKDEEMDIDLFLFSKNGELVSDLPSYVNVLEGNRILYCISNSFKFILKQRNIVNIFIRFVCTLVVRIIGTERFYKIMLKSNEKIGEYDIAISYFHDSPTVHFQRGCNYFVLNNVNAKRKITWIHTDFEAANLDYMEAKKIYKDFDAIINISNALKIKFDILFPEYCEKSYFIYNMFPIEKIKTKALAFNPQYRSNFINLVTVARIDNSSKALYRIMNVCSRLKEDNYNNFIWNIVGDGPDKQSLNDSVNKMELNNIIKFYGHQDNPYPYIKHSDAFILVSKYEGYPMVITESLILDTPVITTRYESCDEQIDSGINGFICKNNEESLYLIIKHILDNPDILVGFKSNLIEKPINNSIALTQFYDVINKLYEKGGDV